MVPVCVCVVDAMVPVWVLVTSHGTCVCVCVVDAMVPVWVLVTSHGTCVGVLVTSHGTCVCVGRFAGESERRELRGVQLGEHDLRVGPGA